MGLNGLWERLPDLLGFSFYSLLRFADPEPQQTLATNVFGNQSSASFLSLNNFSRLRNLVRRNKAQIKISRISGLRNKYPEYAFKINTLFKQNRLLVQSLGSHDSCKMEINMQTKLSAQIEEMACYTDACYSGKVSGNTRIKLKDLDTGWAQNEETKFLGKGKIKEMANKLLEENRRELANAQELLFANNTYALLVILQGMDAAGKDGIIKHVMCGLNPQGCRVTSFKQPSTMELKHDFLWRQVVALPGKGMIGIFNRSYYEEVLIAKVHRNLLENQNLPVKRYDRKFWKNRYEDITSFEHHLVRNGTLVLKFFLNISKNEQRKRFVERLNDPSKYWKFSDADLKERGCWDNYVKAYEEMINNTSTKWAPWYIIPADYKWLARSLVSDIITTSIMSLGIKLPVLSRQKLEAIEEAKRKLE
jgi:PPK2 family polyphosphate:nucleotide phosphotransferase